MIDFYGYYSTFVVGHDRVQLWAIMTLDKGSCMTPC